MSLESTNSLNRLKDRARMLSKCRSFFEKKGILETDVPSMSQRGSIDVHIDLVEVKCNKTPCFLHSSPEYGMKRLLAEQIGDIYQLSHVFRDGELGIKHNPEFMMAEWYRYKITFDEMIEETVEFIRLFLEDLPSQYEKIDYRDLFMQHLGCYPSTLEEREYRFAFEIEPKLGQNQLTVLYNFPPEQASLSQVNAEGFAERFEIFYKGTELSNGFHELTDPVEQKKRLLQANEERIAIGKQPYPLDTFFLQALEKGIGDCCGVAVGFDRLMMLRHKVQTINEVIPFGWEIA